MDCLVIYDAECVLCNRLLRWIASYRNNGFNIRFTSFDSSCANKVFKRFEKAGERNSFYYVVNDRIFSKSGAIRRILNDMGGSTAFLSRLLWLIPDRGIDFLYDLVASNRYRIFGKTDKCNLLAFKDRELIINDCNQL